MSGPFFFGYGSLVNRATHAYGRVRPARVHGWRRAWRHTGLRETAFLSAVPAPGDAIEGLIAEVPGADWAALDEREEGYDRHRATGQVEHDLSGHPDIQIYAIPAAADRPRRLPVLLSYLDVVLQGYLAEFGEAGARRFVETTDGWEVAVLDDRTAPQYPRHQTLTAAERGFVDALLAGLPLHRIAPGHGGSAR